MTKTTLSASARRRAYRRGQCAPHWAENPYSDVGRREAWERGHTDCWLFGIKPAPSRLMISPFELAMLAIIGLIIAQL